jgi:hypothetical protein
VHIAYIFDFLVIPLFVLKFRIYGPINLFVVTILYNQSELLIYNPALRRKNGVAGNPGTKTPNTPDKSERVPKEINIVL